MALSKDFTLQRARGILRTLINKISDQEVLDEDIDDIAHLGICYLVGRLGEAVFEDYGEKAAVSLASAPAYSGVVTATSYANSTKLVTKASHGLSVGTPLVYWDDGGYMQVGYVVSVPTTGTFTVDKAIGATVTNFKYLPFTAYDGSVIDLSGIRLNNIVKLVDDTNGLIRKENAVEIEGTEGNLNRKKYSHYYKHGEKLYVVKGSDAPAFGTLYLYYNRIPTKAVSDSDYLDIKDEFALLAIDVAKIKIYEMLKETPPEALTNTVNNSIDGILAANDREMQRLQTQRRTKN